MDWTVDRGPRRKKKKRDAICHSPPPLYIVQLYPGLARNRGTPHLYLYVPGLPQLQLGCRPGIAAVDSTGAET